jgi:hypothetical protein
VTDSTNSLCRFQILIPGALNFTTNRDISVHVEGYDSNLNTLANTMAYCIVGTKTMEIVFERSYASSSVDIQIQMFYLFENIPSPISLVKTNLVNITTVAETLSVITIIGDFRQLQASFLITTTAPFELSSFEFDAPDVVTDWTGTYQTSGKVSAFIDGSLATVENCYFISVVGTTRIRVGFMGLNLVSNNVVLYLSLFYTAS